MSVPLEQEEMETLAEWLDAAGVLWCHVPGGDAFLGPGPIRFARANRLRKSGVKPGVPDVLIFDPPPLLKDDGYIGTALELKRRRGPRGGLPPNGKPSPAQDEWLDRLWHLGWWVHEDPAYGAEEAIAWLRDVCGYGK